MAKKVSDDATADTGDPAGGDASIEGLIAAGRIASAEQLDGVADYLKAAEDTFRAAYPKLSAAIDAWQAKGGPAPTAVRIVSKIDGFRRAGMAHSKEAAEHPVESFHAPEQLEALFAEPNLIVEFV